MNKKIIKNYFYFCFDYGNGTGYTSLYLKLGYLFVTLRSLGLCVPRLRAWYRRKDLSKGGTLTWFHGIWTYNVKVMHF